jgi:hypothetical protein
MSTITQSSTRNRNATITPSRKGAIVCASIDDSHSINLVRRPLSHNHCGWPGIGPTSPGLGVGDILYWTTPGAFHYGPIERNLHPQP